MTLWYCLGVDLNCGTSDSLQGKQNNYFSFLHCFVIILLLCFPMMTECSHEEDDQEPTGFVVFHHVLIKKASEEMKLLTWQTD